MTFDSLLDITKHTHGLGFISMVKLIHDEEENVAKIEAIEDNNAVVMYGKLRKPIEGLSGTVGLGRMGILSGYLSFAPFTSKEANVSIVNEDRSGSSVPTEILFDSKQGHTANYRFMSEQFANDQIQVPPFTGANFPVDVSPKKEGIKDLTTMHSILGSFESNFTAKTNNGNLEFHIGSGGADRTIINFAKGIDGTLSHAWSYPLHHVLTILKLHASSSSMKLYFSDRGVMKIAVDSGMADYTYIIPARKD